MSMSNDSPMNVALVGFGNIGSGVVRHLAARRGLLDARTLRPLRLAMVCDIDIETPRDAPVDGVRMTTDYREVIADPSVEAVIELVGGTSFAFQLVKDALSAGKHVVTANKALLATYGGELFGLARDNGVELLFESSVLAGVPIMKAMQMGITPNDFHSVAGILNGTCNYILTEMSRDATLSYGECLATAQELGYAEPDPTLDVEGIDAAHKVAVLGSLAFGMDLRIEHVVCEGVTRIAAGDFAFGRSHGLRLKLLGVAVKDDDGYAALSVWPTYIPDTQPIAHVDGVVNALLVDAQPIGQTLYVGAGAGADSTASGIVADLMLLANVADARSRGALNSLAHHAVAPPRLATGPVHPVRCLRATGPGAAQAVAGAGCRPVHEDGNTAYSVAPAQTADEREEMLGRLAAAGIPLTSICEMRFAFQPDGQPTPF